MDQASTSTLDDGWGACRLSGWPNTQLGAVVTVCLPPRQRVDDAVAHIRDPKPNTSCPHNLPPKQTIPPKLTSTFLSFGVSGTRGLVSELNLTTGLELGHATR